MTADVYSMDEAAARLHKSRRWLQDWLRDHPVDGRGEPFYSPLGRTKTFDDYDLERIRATAREEERCRLRSSRPVRAKRRTTRAAARHLGVYVDRSTKARKRALAVKVIRQWERDIERGQFVAPGEPTFASAAVAYMNAGGQRRPLAPLLRHFGEKALKTIDQAAIDEAAVALFPHGTAATRNREIYTPVSAVLKRAGFNFKIRRPKGWRGRIVRRWLWPDQAWRVITAAYELDPELGLLCVMLLFGGLRISEQLAMRADEVRLDEAFAFVPDSKNGEPQPMHLTESMVAALRGHPRGLGRPGERLFRFHKGGGLDFKLIQGLRRGLRFCHCRFRGGGQAR